MSVSKVSGGDQAAALVALVQAGDKAAVLAWVVELLQDRGRVDALAVWVMEGNGGAWSAALLLTRGLRGCAQAADRLEAAVDRAVELRQKAQGDPQREARNRAALQRQAAFRALCEAAKLTWAPELPEGWECCERGVWPVDEDGQPHGERAARYPILVAGAQEADGDELIEVAWSKDKGVTWSRAGLARHVARSARALVDAAPGGLPVDSNTAGALVKWLGDLEAVNAVRMPRTRVALRMGWVPEGFVLGGRVVARPGAAELEVGAGQQLHGLKAALRTVGTWDGWCEVMRQAVAGRPLVAVPLLASVASVLLEPLKAKGFILSMDGGSGGGKSTALALGASVWGSPDGYMRKWDATQVGIEDLAHVLRHLPLFLDETQLAREGMVGTMLYAVPEGMGRQRGQPSSVPKELKDWQLVLVASGEQSILAFAAGAGGAAARALSIPGRPFGAAPEGSDEEKANWGAARACGAGVKANAGHLGPRVLAWVMAQKEGMLQDRFEVLHQHYGNRGVGAGRRLAEYVAVLRLAQEVAELVGMPTVGEEPIELIWAAAQQSALGVDVATAAMRSFVAWTWSNRDEFAWKGPSEEKPKRAPHGGWVGFIDLERAELCVVKVRLDKLLTEWGYKPDNITTAWAARGWLLPGREGRKTVYRQVPDGPKADLYGFRRALLEDFGGS